MPADASTLPQVVHMHPIGTGELSDALEAAILAGADGRLSRGAELFMAAVCAPVLADRLEAAGLVVGRPVGAAEG